MGETREVEHAADGVEGVGREEDMAVGIAGVDGGLDGGGVVVAVAAGGDGAGVCSRGGWGKGSGGCVGGALGGRGASEGCENGEQQKCRSQCRYHVWALVEWTLGVKTTASRKNFQISLLLSTLILKRHVPVPRF